MSESSSLFGGPAPAGSAISLYNRPSANHADKVHATIALLNPITPHLSQYLWWELGHSTELEQTAWPVVDASALVEDEKLVVVQIKMPCMKPISMHPTYTAK